MIRALSADRFSEITVCSLFIEPLVLAWLLNSLFVSTTLPNATQRNVEMNTRTQILMPFLHPKQITHKDNWKYEEKRMKNRCLPGIAFSYCKIFTVVFLECCGPFVLRAGWHSGMNFSEAIWFALSHWACGACKSGALLPGCSDLRWKKKKKMAWCKWVKATLKCFCLSDALDTESGAIDQPLGCLNTLAGLRHLLA